MANQGASTWTTIAAHQFQHALEAYEPLIQSISDTKGGEFVYWRRDALSARDVFAH